MEGVREVLKLIPYGLHAIAVRAGEARNAFTANWVMQCSSEPPMVVVAVENGGRSISLMRAAGAFSINLFAAGQRREAALLARPAARAPDKLAEFEHVAGVTGAPLLTAALAYLECRVMGEVPAGDHTLFLAEIVAGGRFREGEPLEIHAAGFTYT